MEQLFNQIKREFGSIWRMSMRGETMVITTPMATTTHMFVAVYVSKKDNGYVVSDGGCLSMGDYETKLPYKEKNFLKIFNHYKETYGIKTLNANGWTYYYKTTTNPIMIASLVFDMSSFIGAIASAAEAINTTVVDQRNEAFKYKANDFIRQTFEKEKYKLSLSIDGFPDVTLSAVLFSDSGTTLVNYVSGSNFGTFAGNLCKSAYTFQIIRHKQPDITIHNQIHLLDTESLGFKDSKSRPYIDTITSEHTSQVLHWEDREELTEIVA